MLSYLRCPHPCFDAKSRALCYKVRDETPMNKPTVFPAFILCLLLAFAAVLLAGGPASPPAGNDLWPTKGWATASPASVGLD